MKEYESVFVLDPDVEDSQVDTEVQKIRDFLTSKDCEITEVQKWGRRKLAYEINKNKEGIYTLIRFNAEAGVPVELDRRYRLNESLLRFLTVVYERPPVGEGVPEGEGEAGASRPATPVPAATAAGSAAPAPAAAATPPVTPAPAGVAAGPGDAPGGAAPGPGAATEPAKEPEAAEAAVPVVGNTDATAGEKTPEDDEKPSQE